MKVKGREIHINRQRNAEEDRWRKREKEREREKERKRGGDGKRGKYRDAWREGKENEIDTKNNQGRDSMWFHRPRKQCKAAWTPDGF